jgi:hypothetical protein
MNVSVSENPDVARQQVAIRTIFLFPMKSLLPLYFVCWLVPLSLVSHGSAEDGMLALC